MDRFSVVKRFGPFLAAVALALPGCLAAQSAATTGVIRGTVADASGAVVVGATATLRNVATNVTRVVQSNEAGVFVAPLLPLGTYEVKVRAVGHRPVEQNGISVTVGSIVALSFKLERAATELQAVTISATQDVRVDPSRTTVAASLGASSIKALPNNGRNFLALTTLTPNVAIAQGPDGDVLSIAGQRGIHNNVSVDGADFNNPFFGEQRGGQRPAFTFNLDAVQEMVVTAQGANAEFGRSSGGFVNVITKSGTNTRAGSLHYFGKSSALSGDLKGNGVTLKPDFAQHQFGFTLGGPIRKDKAWFFVAYDQQAFSETKQKDRGSSPAFTKLKAWTDTAYGGALRGDFGPTDRTNDAQVLMLKIDYKVSDRTNASLKYNFTDSKQVNGTFDVDSWARSANAVENDFSNAINGQLTTQWSSAVTNEARFQFSREDRPRDYEGPTFPGGRRFPDTAMDFGGNFRLGMPFFIPVKDFDDRIQILDNVTWARGNHLMKVGAEYNRTRTKQTFIGFANGRFIFSSVDGFLNYVSKGNGYVECSNGTSSTTGTCPAGSSIAGPVLLYLQQAGVGGRSVEEAGTQEIVQHEVAMFAQDSWKVNDQLSLNYGLRWEMQKQPDPQTPPGSVFFGPFIGKSVTNTKGTFRFPSDGTIQSDYGMFQPRFGFSYDVSGDATQWVRGSAGLYYARIPGLNLASVRSTNGSVGQTIFRNSALTGILGAPPKYNELLPAPTGTPFGPDVFVMDENFRNPRTMSASLAYEKHLDRGLSATVTYNWSKTDFLTRFVNRNDAAFGSPWSTGLAGGNGITTLTTVEATAKSQFNGVTVGLARVKGERLTFDANYTLAFDKSDDDNERDPFTFTYARADRLDREWGYSNRDQRHRFNLSALTKGPMGTLINGRFSYLSATPVSEKCGAGNTGSGERAASPSDRVCANGTILQRNTLRRDNEYASFDLKLTRLLPALAGHRPEAVVEVFNVLGRNNFRDPSTNSLLFNFDGTIRSGLGDPRQVQAGLRWEF